MLRALAGLVLKHTKAGCSPPGWEERGGEGAKRGRGERGRGVLAFASQDPGCSPGELLAAGVFFLACIQPASLACSPRESVPWVPEGFPWACLSCSALLRALQALNACSALIAAPCVRLSHQKWSLLLPARSSSTEQMLPASPPGCAFRL